MAITNLFEWLFRYGRKDASPRSPPPDEQYFQHCFDQAHYLEQCGGSIPEGEEPWLHFTTRGWRASLNPHPNFNVAWYLSNNPDVRSTEVNPFCHFLTTGWREGRKPTAEMCVDIDELERLAQQPVATNPLDHLVPDPHGCIPETGEAAPEATSAAPDFDDEQFIRHAYQALLLRQASPADIAHFKSHLSQGMTRGELLETIAFSQECLQKVSCELLPSLSNQEFVNTVSQQILNHHLNIEHMRQWVERLDQGYSRLRFVQDVLNTEDFLNISDRDRKPEHEPGRALIMGTGEFIEPKEWNQRLAEVLADPERSAAADEARNELDDLELLAEHLAGSPEGPLVSIITSLYKGGQFIDEFLENMTSQLGFREFCELIIIDAASPDGEQEKIIEYQARYPWIVYQRTEEVITIYEAWNMAVEMSRGRFLTNANVDDLRRRDCFARQAEELLRDPSTDVVYQDFFYSLTPRLPFTTIAVCGIRSDLPPLNHSTLLRSNLPHCAPMWRRNLHERIGMFDTRFLSAADWEMWLRAAVHGSRFRKIEETLVAYYNNPEGISTKKDTPGIREAIELQQRYGRLLSSSPYGLPRGDFEQLCATALGLKRPLEKAAEGEDRDTYLYRAFNACIAETPASRSYVTLEDSS